MKKTVVVIFFAFLAFFQCSFSLSQDDCCMTAKVDGDTLVINCTNKSGKDLVFWELGNMWGDSSFYLVLKNRETAECVVCNYGHSVYGRHIPEVQLVKDGKIVEYRINLRDRKWSDSKALADTRFQIKTVIISPAIDEEAIANGVLLKRLQYQFTD
jgi:hypothetical protein